MLEQMRKLHGYTQEQLAKEVGITQNYYTQLESGKARSERVILKLSEFLKIKESFLASSGEYYEYPFLSDFYKLFLTEQRIAQSYRFLIDYICSKSKYIDAVFFRRPKIGFPVTSQIICLALLDDRQTLFFFQRRAKRFSLKRDHPSLRAETNASNDEQVMPFPLIDLFREELYKLSPTYIYERTVLIDDDLSKKIEDGTVERDDLMTYFRNKDYFKGLYESHLASRKR